MRRRLGASMVAVVLFAVVSQSSGAGSEPSREAGPPASSRSADPDRVESSLRAGERRPAPPPRVRPLPLPPEMGCSYPADVPRRGSACPPRRDDPLTPGAAPGRPWLTRG